MSRTLSRLRPVALLSALVVLAACTGAPAATSSARSDVVSTTPAAATSPATPATTGAAGSTASTTVTSTPSSTAPTAPKPTAPATTAPVTADTLPPQVRPGVEIPPGQVQAAVGELDGLAASIMASTGVPGMAVAVVYKGKVIYARGFGVRRVGQPAKVDADTVFQLASVSKPIGATVIAHEVTAGNIAWDTPVLRHLPSFKLADPYVTKTVTVGDLYAHRSGLPAHAGDLLEDLGYSRTQIIDRLKYLALNPFRTTYGYSNYGITTAAQSVANAAGTDWATLSREVLYTPLGMIKPSSRFADYAAAKNRAYTHVKVNGTWVAKYVRDADQQSPAGGVSSTVNDLAKWMIMVLGQGTGAGAVKITSPQALTPAVTPEIISSPAQQLDARPGFYGYGFDVTTQASGRVQISHSGAFSAGTGTNFVMMPLADVGIVTLTNGSPIGAAEALN